MAIRHQIAVALETKEGEKATITADDFLTLADRPTVNITPQTRERETQSESLSPQKTVIGRVDFSVTAPVDLIGSRDPKLLPTETPPPPIDKLLLNGGFKRESVPAVYVTTMDHEGTFVPGEEVSWDNAGPQTALVVGYSRPRAGNVGLLVLIQPSGVIQDGAVITGEAPNNPPTATANGLGLIRNFWRYTPVSKPYHVITANHATWTGIGGVAAGDLLIRVDNTYVEQTGWQPLGVLTAAPIDLTGGDYEFRFENAVFAIQFSVGDQFAVKKPDGTIVNFGGSAPSVATIAAGHGPSATVQSRLEDKKIRTGVGCRSALGIRGTAGETCVLNAEITGAFLESIGGALMAGVTEVDLQNIPLFELAAVTLDGKPFPVQSYELTMGTTVSQLPDAHGASGFRGGKITARAPVHTIDPDLVHPAAFDFDAKLKTATSVAFVCQIGWQAANTFLIRSTNCQIVQAQDGDRDGVATVNTQLRACKVTTGDDEIEILAL